MQHLYSVARVVPDVARGEFINVGIIVGSDESREWTLRDIGNLSRTNHLDDENLLPAVMGQLASVGGVLQRFVSSQEMLIPAESIEQVDSEWLSRLAYDSANTLQFTMPRPISADSAEEALELLWDELILEPATRRFDFLKKYRAVVEVRQALHARQIGAGHLIERARFGGRHHESSMDFVIHDSQAVQLANCWSC